MRSRSGLAIAFIPCCTHFEEKGALSRSYDKSEGAARPRRYYHLERKGQHLLREKRVEWATFTTAVDRVLKGGVCLWLGSETFYPGQPHRALSSCGGKRRDRSSKTSF
ncbi:MAG: hypothetical protein ACLRSD_03060 [Oscillibacter sp.]